MYEKCYTGLNDRFGNKLYEGMTVKFRYGFNKPEIFGKIMFFEGKFVISYHVPLETDYNRSVRADFSYLWSPTVLKTIEIQNNK